MGLRFWPPCTASATYCKRIRPFHNVKMCRSRSVASIAKNRPNFNTLPIHVVGQARRPSHAAKPCLSEQTKTTSVDLCMQDSEGSGETKGCR